MKTFTAKTSKRNTGGYQTIVTDGEHTYFAFWGVRSESIDFESHEDDNEENDYCFSSGRNFATDDIPAIIASVEASACEEAIKFVESLDKQLDDNCDGCEFDY